MSVFSCRRHNGLSNRHRLPTERNFGLKELGSFTTICSWLWDSWLARKAMSIFLHNVSVNFPSFLAFCRAIPEKGNAPPALYTGAFRCNSLGCYDPVRLEMCKRNRAYMTSKFDYFISIFIHHLIILRISGNYKFIEIWSPSHATWLICPFCERSPLIMRAQNLVEIMPLITDIAQISYAQNLVMGKKGIQWYVRSRVYCQDK